MRCVPWPPVELFLARGLGATHAHVVRRSAYSANPESDSDVDDVDDVSDLADVDDADDNEEDDAINTAR